MAKRKRDIEDHDSAHGQEAKKAKRQALAASKSEPAEAPKSKAKPSRNQNEAKPLESETDGARTSILPKRERRLEKKRLEREQKAALEAQLKPEKKEDDAIESSDAIASKEHKKQKQKKEKRESALEESGGEDANHVPTALRKPKKRKHEKITPENKERDLVHRPSHQTTSKIKKPRHKDKRNSETGNTPSKKTLWRISDPVGGQMLDIDPIFSRDERYLLVAYDTAILVYSTSTSLPVRRLSTNKSSRLSAFALSSSIDGQVFVSTAAGQIELWDWTEGSRLGRWKLSSSVHSLQTSPQSGHGSGHEIVYTVDRKDAGPWLISAHILAIGEDARKADVKTLFTYENPLCNVQILAGGRFVLATSGSQLIIGNTDKPNPSVLQELSYTWRIVDCPEWITSINARISQIEIVAKSSKGGTRTHEALDIAVGGLKGAIHIYDNLLGKLVRTEQPTSNEIPEEIKSRRLHWHRNAVLSVKWSLDGNYLISGGQETVLVLWQLETGRRQDIPHLGAPIESVVVSPFGASYGVRLADNSAMILSTSELTPTFSIAGVQIPVSRDDTSLDLPFTPTVDAPRQRKTPVQRSHFPACISSSRPGCLLLAIPPSTSPRQSSTVTSNASYLQSFDIGASHQISRQALTRTKITTLNMGPESNTIEEPNVTHLRASANGQWLATIDVWMPPKRDLASLAFDQENLAEEQTFRQEVYLKFWSWSDDTKVWELVSRIDNPHASQSGNPYEHGDVLQLSSDPSSVGFATVGADATVKTWRPAIRRRHGLYVRDKEGKSLTSWHCKHVIPLESTELSSESSQPSAKLAYSQDGSVLVAGLQTNVPSPLYILNTHNGEIRDIKTGLYNGPLFGIGIISKYLITLSHELCVWDLVNDDLSFGINLNHARTVPSHEQMVSSHLAVDFQHGMFAIASPESRSGDTKPSELRSQVAVFDPTNAAPLFQISMPHTIIALLPAIGRKGFYAIDSAAEVRTIIPSQSLPSIQSTPSKDEQSIPRGLNDIFGNGQSMKSIEPVKDVGLLTSKFENVTQASRGQDDDAVVVSQDQLAEIFDVGLAYPPVSQMFEQVASLYSGRTAP